MLLDIKEELHFLKCKAIEYLHVWFPKNNVSFNYPLCQFVLCSQVSYVLWGFKPFVIPFATWLYAKYVYP